MMSFTSYTIMFSRDKKGNLPTPQSVIKELLDDGEIPLRVISNKQDETFKGLQDFCPELKVEYIIVVVNYTNVFYA